MKQKITCTWMMLFFVAIVHGQGPEQKFNEKSDSTRELLSDEVFYESFETWPPAGWTFSSPDSSKNWVQKEKGFKLPGFFGSVPVTVPSVAGEEHFAFASGGNDQWMISPAITINRGDSLSFWRSGVYAWGADLLAVMVSQSDCNIFSFTDTLGQYGIDEYNPETWTKYKVDMSNYEGKTIYIAWKVKYIKESYFFILIDMVRIGPKYMNDAVLLSIKPSGYFPEGEMDISGTLSNQGSDVITQADITWQIDDGPLNTEQFSGLSVAEDEGFNFVFKDKINVTPGKYSLKMNISHINGQESDENPWNDSVKSFFTVSAISFPKVHLIEEFTSSTCSCCMPYNKNVVGPATANFADKITVVKYQMDWPYPGDKYYIPENGNRRNFYNVMGVPALYIDGITSPKLSDEIPNQENLDYIDSVMMAKDEQLALVEIKSTHSITPLDGNIELNAKITPYLSGAEFKTFVCLVEKKTTGNRGNNGETEFFSVLMKMLPDSLGIPMSFVEEIPEDIHITSNLKETNIEEFTDLAVVVFVQNMNTKKVIQTAYSEDIANTTRTIDMSLRENDIIVYPNPSKGIVNISGACGANLQIYDLTGREIFSKNVLECLEELDMAGFKNGIYLLKVTKGERFSIHKLTVY